MQKAVTKHVRISPRKARLVMDMIRGQGVETAKAHLLFAKGKGARLISKTLESAVANAENNEGLRRENLVILEAKVDGGPTWKRARSKCRGGRAPINKRTSHFTIIVG